MSKITNDGLIRSGARCFIAVPTWQQSTVGVKGLIYIRVQALSIPSVDFWRRETDQQKMQQVLRPASRPVTPVSVQPWRPAADAAAVCRSASRRRSVVVRGRRR